MHHIKRMKYENHMVISIDTERECEIIKEPSMIKNTQPIAIRRMYLNTIKVILNKFTADIKISGESLKGFLLKI